MSKINKQVENFLEAGWEITNDIQTESMYIHSNLNYLMAAARFETPETEERNELITNTIDEVKLISKTLRALLDELDEELEKVNDFVRT